MSPKAKSTSPLAPCNWSTTTITVMAFILGMILKYADIIGDKEMPSLTEEQNNFHSKVSMLLMTVMGIIFSFANIESCFMSIGAVLAWTCSFKVEVLEHMLPFFFIVVVPIPLLLHFKDASWNNVDLSGDGWERGIVVTVQLTIFGAAEEFIHEFFDDHPNPYVNFFFDIRPINHIITGLFYLASSKNMLVPKKYNKLVDWWTVFLNTCFFGWGYELVRVIFKKYLQQH